MKSAVIGSGDPVILLHEWLGDHRNWLPMLKHCQTDKFSFHCLDLPGYGLSHEKAATPSVEAIAGLVLDYAKEREFERFTLVGHSMSGLVAHHLGVIAPQSLADLVFFCPVPPNGFVATDANIASMHSVASEKSALREAILARGGEVETDQWVKEKVDLAWSASTPEIKHAYLKMFLAPVAPKARKSAVRKAKIICGEIDLPFYREDSLKMEFAPYYDEATIITLDRCGHYPMLQNPKLAADTLIKCLQT